MNALELRCFGAVHGVHFGDLDQPFAAQMLCDIFAGSDVRQIVGKPFASGRNPTGGAFLTALRSLEDRHVIGLASRPDPRHHRDQKHSANGLGVLVFFSAEIDRQKIDQSFLSEDTMRLR